MVGLINREGENHYASMQALGYCIQLARALAMSLLATVSPFPSVRKINCFLVT